RSPPNNPLPFLISLFASVSFRPACSTGPHDSTGLPFRSRVHRNISCRVRAELVSEPLELRYVFNIEASNGGSPMVKLLAFIGFVAIVAVIVAAVFFFGGFFNVAASEKDPKIVEWALVKFREASIARHAEEHPPVSLDDSMIVREGARIYSEKGCVHCHGAPG